MPTVYLIASGDMRLAANRNCWKAQDTMEQQVMAAVQRAGGQVLRGHPFDPEKGHGFIDSQKYGMEVFRGFPADAPLIVAEAVWQYTHHVFAGLLTHQGPILTVANWSGTWPGLVGMLNLNASLSKAGVPYSSLWSEDFTDAFFCDGLQRWLDTGKLVHDTSHVRRLQAGEAPGSALETGRAEAHRLRSEKAIMGIFDEGCMGMYNAIIPDELLHPTGIFKERLSQSALFAAMRGVAESEARGVYEWLLDRGMSFALGSDASSELTEAQVLDQCRMYIAALRMADDFGCATIGIQYQQGLKDLAPASDLVEGLLNNVDRPPVCAAASSRELYAGQALPHFNEVDECAGVDALVTNRIWRRLGLPPETTLHDIRWGRQILSGQLDAFVWILEISGAVPPAHLEGGYAGAISERQPPMYFPLGGGSIKGVSRPGWVVWSRVFVEGGMLHCDLGLGQAVRLPEEETRENWRQTTSQWPMMHLVLRGITRDQMMARHRANHIQVAYATDYDAGKHALYAKAAAMQELGMGVCLCGDI